jgi:hypothetical protein
MNSYGGFSTGPQKSRTETALMYATGNLKELFKNK